MRRYSTVHRDSNEPAIVQALEAAGAAVQRLDGDGLPDLLVGFRGKLMLLEVKLPLGPRGGVPRRRGHEGGSGDMTAAQVRWWSTWKGPAPVIVRSAEEALAAIGALEGESDDGEQCGVPRSQWPDADRAKRPSALARRGSA